MSSFVRIIAVAAMLASVHAATVITTTTTSTKTETINPTVCSGTAAPGSSMTCQTNDWTVNAQSSVATTTTGGASPTTASTPVWSLYQTGCYAEASNARVLSTRISVSQTNTIQSCQAAARAQNFVFASMQYGTECWGGNSLLINPPPVASNCNMACSGNAAQICGGLWASNLYRFA